MLKTDRIKFLKLVLVATDHVVVVDWKPLVGVDRDTEKPRVGVNKKLHVSESFNENST